MRTPLIRGVAIATGGAALVALGAIQTIRYDNVRRDRSALAAEVRSGANQKRQGEIYIQTLQQQLTAANARLADALSRLAEVERRTSAQPSLAPKRVPQGTVVIRGFSQNPDIGCSTFTVTIGNASDTAILSVTLTFQMDAPAERVTDTEAAGIPPYTDKALSFQACTSGSPPSGELTSGTPIAGSLRWRWAIS